MTDNLVRRELLIQFETKENGEVKTRTKAIKNIRYDASEANLATFGSQYANLTDQTHLKSLLANYAKISE
ncbi:MAG TPA: hypothetical protein DCY20_07405 [Firmicutes bacterium]|nr:hypothetical protein [Bacillota bacterium]